jgi:glycerophosphoryl diester phosphodiesterase
MPKTNIIAHRGAFGHFPEHTIAGYNLALELGSDYVELDLVLSKDNIFFAFHDILLDEITNIKEIDILQQRISTRVVNGEEITGYFVCDFTSIELKQIKIRQRYLSTRSHYFDNIYEIPTLSEIVQMVKSYFNPFKRYL